MPVLNLLAQVFKACFARAEAKIARLLENSTDASAPSVRFSNYDDTTKNSNAMRRTMATLDLLLPQ